MAYDLMGIEHATSFYNNTQTKNMKIILVILDSKNNNIKTFDIFDEKYLYVLNTICSKISNFLYEDFILYN